MDFVCGIDAHRDTDSCRGTCPGTLACATCLVTVFRWRVEVGRTAPRPTSKARMWDTTPTIRALWRQLPCLGDQTDRPWAACCASYSLHSHLAAELVCPRDRRGKRQWSRCDYTRIPAQPAAGLVRATPTSSACRAPQGVAGGWASPLTLTDERSTVESPHGGVTNRRPLTRENR